MTEETLSMMKAGAQGTSSQEWHIRLLVAEVRRVRAALEKCGVHVTDCATGWDGECDCGFAEALKGMEEAKELNEPEVELRLTLAFNHVIDARNACRDLRQSLPEDLRQVYLPRLITIETLCSIALVDARKAGVQGLREEKEG